MDWQREDYLCAAFQALVRGNASQADRFCLIADRLEMGPMAPSAAAILAPAPRK